MAAVIDGGAGNDTISGGDLGNDLFGGLGDDTLTGGRLDDWMFGGDGNDTLSAGASGQLGGDGNYLSGGAGNDTLNGAEGSDWLEGGAGVDTLKGGGGDDVLGAGAGNDVVIEGGSGNDQYLFRRGDGTDMARDSITDTAPGITLGGTAANALRSYMLGQNALALSKRNFAQQSSSADAGGDDSLVLGAGITLSDVFLQRGFSGVDASGTKIANDDLIIRLLSNSVATGDEITLKDFFTSSGKIEWLVFADGTRIRIGDFTSFLVGTAGPDVLIGTDGRDFVFGGGGNDKIKALGGDDIANGGTGDDQVEGGSGNDIVIGGLGDDDWVAGGAGNDVFKYSRGDGKDVFLDDYAGTWETIWQNGTWNETIVSLTRDASNNVTAVRLKADNSLIWDGKRCSTMRQRMVINLMKNIGKSSANTAIAFAPHGVNDNIYVSRRVA